jgi:hypothetical protein
MEGDKSGKTEGRKIVPGRLLRINIVPQQGRKERFDGPDATPACWNDEKLWKTY